MRFAHATSCLLVLLAAGWLFSAAKRPPVISAEPSAVTVHPGETVGAQVVVKVKEGFHVQANPASEEYLIPTKLELKAAEGLQPGTVVYPKGQPFRLEGSDKPLSTYMNTFTIKVPIEADAKAQPGEKAMSGLLRYQACDARSCLFPDSIPVQVPVTVK